LSAACSRAARWREEGTEKKTLLDALHGALVAGDAAKLIRFGARQCNARPDGNITLAELDLSDLPTYGGPAPNDTLGIYSWDETRLLIRADDGSWQLIKRTMLGATQGNAWGYRI